jgi:hypothetical protein
MTAGYRQAFIALAVLGFSNGLVLAYEVQTHAQFSRISADASVLSEIAALKRLGLVFSIVDPKQTFPNSRGAPRTVRQLISEGSMFEDDGIRPLNHFYDPVNDTGVLYTSPNWALEDNQGAAFQNWSYHAGREYFFLALTNPSRAERERNWGRMFETLGRVVHHIQDMAQPQHVRMDMHLNIRETLEAWGLDPNRELFFENRSRYEIYTEEPAVRDSIAPAMSAGAGPISFPKARDYWKNSTGTGMAEYTNGNFVSQGTNFLLMGGMVPAASPGYANPVPSPTPTEIAPIRALFAAKGKIVPPGVAAACPLESDCNVLFFGSAVSPRASSLSIFDEDLVATNRAITYTNLNTGETFQVDRLFALNEFNFDAAHELLMPKATSYSTGLINHFFRGRLKVGLPAERVYSVIDHYQPASGGPEPNTWGFTKLRANVQNLTVAAGGGVEQMGNTGRLYAVAKYRRNTCYKNDLSGEFGAPDVDWHQCYSGEEVTASYPANVPASIDTAGVDVEFAFQDPIPISAINLELQIIYRGPLGDELDALVVETKDISEPTYAYNFVTWDQGKWSYYPTLEPGNYPFTEWCAQGFGSFEACAAAMGVTMRYSFANGAAASFSESADTWHDISGEPAVSTLIKMTTPVGKFQRVAALFDLEPPDPRLLLQEQIDDYHGRGQYQWNLGPYTPSIIKVDPESNQVTSPIVYGAGRGVWVPQADAARLNWLDPYLLPQDWPSPLEMIRSQVLF